MPHDDEDETWLIGAEHDASLFHRLGSALESLGYQFDRTSWGVAGSQEVTTWHASSSDGSLTVEAETYVGLSVRGPKRLIAALQRRFASSSTRGL